MDNRTDLKIIFVKSRQAGNCYTISNYRLESFFKLSPEQLSLLKKGSFFGGGQATNISEPKETGEGQERLFIYEAETHCDSGD